MRKFGMLLAAMLAPGMIVGAALAADAVKKDQSILDRLYANTGVYNRRLCRTIGCLARSAGFMSIRTITSGSITGPGP